MWDGEIAGLSAYELESRTRQRDDYCKRLPVRTRSDFACAWYAQTFHHQPISMKCSGRALARPEASRISPAGCRQSQCATKPLADAGTSLTAERFASAPFAFTRNE